MIVLTEMNYTKKLYVIREMRVQVYFAILNWESPFKIFRELYRTQIEEMKLNFLLTDVGPLSCVEPQK